MKRVFTPDPPLRPGDFAIDFQAGQQPDSNCEPEVVRRYVTPQKERIDIVCKRVAMIFDCSSLTLTELNLATKTYSVAPLLVVDDGTADLLATESRTGIASTIELERTPLGTATIGGLVTDGYRVLTKQWTTSAALSVTTSDDWTYHFLDTSLPGLTCIDVAAPWLAGEGSPQRYDPELTAFWSARLDKLRSPHFAVAASGPALPPWRIPLFATGVHVQTQKPAVPRETYYFELESGNVRPVASDDAVFSVPASYTKTQG